MWRKLRVTAAMDLVRWVSPAIRSTPVLFAGHPQLKYDSRPCIHETTVPG